MTLTALSLFAGAGGFDLGARMAGLDVVASVERESLPAQALALNGFHPVQADVTGVDFTQWRGVDVVFGGPPCQGHSIANSTRRRADDPRNALAWEMVRAARETGARRVLIENVVTFDKGLLADLLRELTNLGYWVSVKNLNAADYGVPQTRRRRFIWATREFGTHWPNPTHIGRWVSIDTALAGLEFCPAPLPRWIVEKGVKPSWALISARNSNKLGDQGRPAWKPAFTVTGGAVSDRIKHEGQWSMVGVHGIARFQSFPDDYQFVGNRDQQGLQIGNAVPPLLAYALLRGVA